MAIQFLPMLANAANAVRLGAGAPAWVKALYYGGAPLSGAASITGGLSQMEYEANKHGLDVWGNPLPEDSLWSGSVAPPTDILKNMGIFPTKAPVPAPAIDPDQIRRAERNWGGPGFTQGGPIEPEFISTPEGLIPANSHLIPVGYGEGQVDPGFGINKRAYQSGYFNDDDDLRGPMGIAEGFTEGVQGGLRDTRSDWQKWRDSIESVRR